MLADQFLEAAAGARTAAGLDDLARKLWRAHAEGCIADADADADAASAAIEGCRAAISGEGQGGEGPCPAEGRRRTS